jgi:hypothetical protein
MFYGPSEKSKALYIVNCILVSIVYFNICFAKCVELGKNWGRTVLEFLNNLWGLGTE